MYKFIHQKMKGNTMAPAYMVLVLVVVLNIILQPTFFKPMIMKSNILTFTPLILIAMAQAVIMLSGAIDLSIGAGITLINVSMASIMTDQSSSVIIAIVMAFAIALLISMVNGVCITLLKLPAMVATFATAAIWYGIALMIMPQPGGYVPAFFYRLYQKNFLVIIPVPILIIAIAVLTWTFIKKKRIYRYILAVGGNKENAYSSGIKVNKTQFIAFLISGIFMALAAIVVTAQAASGDANLAQAFTLPSVAAGVIGGISLQGGRGKVEGAILGAIILCLLTNVIFFANIPSLFQELIKGIVIIISLVIGILPSLKNKKLII